MTGFITFRSKIIRITISPVLVNTAIHELKKYTNLSTIKTIQLRGLKNVFVVTRKIKWNGNHNLSKINKDQNINA